MVERKRLHRCCFTGHRPEKLNIPEEEVKYRLENAIKESINDGFTTFISGMARGVDMWAAEIVLNIKRKDDRIKLICAMPYDGFERSWNDTEKKRYHRILKKADHIRFICLHYVPQCFQYRNCFMVDNSSRLISAYNGEKGGTKNTIDYARRKGVEIVNIFEDNYF